MPRPLVHMRLTVFPRVSAAEESQLVRRFFEETRQVFGTCFACQLAPDRGRAGQAMHLQKPTVFPRVSSAEESQLVRSLFEQTRYYYPQAA